MIYFISNRDGPIKSTETIKAEMKTCKKTSLLWNNGGKEREEDYSISAVFLCFFYHSGVGSPLVFFITALLLYNT